MRNQNWLAFLIAPLAFVALLLFLGEYSVSAGPHRYSDDDRNDYVRSVAVVWALDSIQDDVSCEDLTGDCDDHDPPRSARERASAFLQGMKVTR